MCSQLVSFFALWVNLVTWWSCARACVCVARMRSPLSKAYKETFDWSDWSSWWDEVLGFFFISVWSRKEINLIYVFSWIRFIDYCVMTSPVTFGCDSVFWWMKIDKVLRSFTQVEVSVNGVKTAVILYINVLSAVVLKILKVLISEKNCTSIGINRLLLRQCWSSRSS